MFRVLRDTGLPTEHNLTYVSIRKHYLLLKSSTVISVYGRNSELFC